MTPHLLAAVETSCFLHLIYFSKEISAFSTRVVHVSSLWGNRYRLQFSSFFLSDQTDQRLLPLHCLVLWSSRDFIAKICRHPVMDTAPENALSPTDIPSVSVDEKKPVVLPETSDTCSASPDLEISSHSLFAFRTDYSPFFSGDGRDGDYNPFFPVNHVQLPPQQEQKQVEEQKQEQKQEQDKEKEQEQVHEKEQKNEQEQPQLHQQQQQQQQPRQQERQHRQHQNPALQTTLFSPHPSVANGATNNQFHVVDHKQGDITVPVSAHDIVDAHQASLQRNSSSVTQTPQKHAKRSDMPAKAPLVSPPDNASTTPSVGSMRSYVSAHDTITAAAAAAAAASVALRREDSDASVDDLIFQAASTATAATSSTDLESISSQNIRVDAQRPYSSLDSNALEAALRSAQNSPFFPKATGLSPSDPALLRNKPEPFNESRRHTSHSAHFYPREVSFPIADFADNIHHRSNSELPDDHFSKDMISAFRTQRTASRIDPAPHLSADAIWQHFDALSISRDLGRSEGAGPAETSQTEQHDDLSSFAFYDHAPIQELQRSGPKGAPFNHRDPPQRHISFDASSSAFSQADYAIHARSESFRAQSFSQSSQPSHHHVLPSVQAHNVHGPSVSLDQQYLSPYAFQPQDLQAQAHAFAAAAAAAVAAQQQHQQHGKFRANAQNHTQRPHLSADSLHSHALSLPRTSGSLQHVPPRTSRMVSSHSTVPSSPMLSALGATVSDYVSDASRQPAPISLLPYAPATGALHPGPSDYLNAQAAAAAAAAAAAVYQNGGSAFAGLRMQGNANPPGSHGSHGAHSGKASFGNGPRSLSNAASHAYVSNRSGNRGHGRGHRNLGNVDHAFDARHSRGSNGSAGASRDGVPGLLGSDSRCQYSGGYSGGAGSGVGGNGDHAHKILTLSDIVGRAEELARDQHGCRSLQTKLEEGNPAYVNAIYDECFDKFVDLMTDPFGNYLCQKLFEFCNDAQRLALVRRCAPSIPHVSTNMHGTRAVQRMVECLSTPEQVRAVCDSLAPAAVLLMKDINGNHVIQRCLNRMNAEDNQFVYDAVANNCFELATHRHGCCVMQRCMDFATPSQRDQLARQINANALPLVQNAFGNYVVQYVLELNEPAYTVEIIRQLQGHIPELSMQKFSSNAVEKSLQLGDRDTRRSLIHELISDADVMRRLLHDAYGNYVIQRALQVAESPQLEQICEAIRPHLNALKQSPYGKRIQAKIMKRMPKCLPQSAVIDDTSPSLSHSSLMQQHNPPHL